MDHAPAPLLDVIASWPADAQRMAWDCRTLFQAVATDIDAGPLTESLKWGQPAWRPRRPRTGSTLRMGWSPAYPTQLSLFVDCKTDLAVRMQSLYPALPGNDGRREIRLDLDTPLPAQAVSHLAAMTFAYHRAKRVDAAVG